MMLVWPEFAEKVFPLILNLAPVLNLYSNKNAIVCERENIDKLGLKERTIKCVLN